MLRHAKSAEENPRWTAGKWYPGSGMTLVYGCLFARGDADSFVPSLIRRPPPITAPPSLLCSTCNLQLGRKTSRSRCLQRSSRRRKRGKSEKGMGLFGCRGLGDCGRRFPGSVSAIVYKGLGQNFPLFQSSLEIPWSPLSATPSPSHSFCHTPLPSSYPSLHLYSTLPC